MPAIIIGDQMKNLQPDGGDYYRSESQFVTMNVGGAIAGAYTVEAKRIEERMQVIAPNLDTQLPKYFAPHEKPDAGCLFVGYRVELDKSGLLAKVVLIWQDPAFTSGTISIGQSETLWELDQTLMQVPIEEDPYFASLEPQELADVISCLEQGQWSGTANGESLGFDEDGDLVYVLPTTPSDIADVMTDLQTELFLMKLKGHDYLMRPGSTFRMMTTNPVTNFPLLMANQGTLQYPGNGLPGTAKNWLLTTPRSERRISEGQTFTMVTQEWLYRAVPWDVPPYNFYKLTPFMPYRGVY